MQHAPSIRILAVAAVVFGLLTVASGGRALFGGADARAALGDVVGYVLWFNFMAGFAYVGAGIGLWLARRWAAGLALALAAATGLVAIVFAFHVLGGGAYEMRTVGALTLRFGFWLGIGWVAWRKLYIPHVRRRPPGG